MVLAHLSKSNSRTF